MNEQINQQAQENVDVVVAVSPARHVRPPMILSALLLAALTACGGGGGGGDEPAAGGDTDNGHGNGSAVVEIDPLPAGTDAFHFEADERLADPAYIRSLTGGDLAAGWNLRDPRVTMVPGMKVAFFGVANGCEDGASNGPVAAGDDAEFRTKAAMTAVPFDAAAPTLRWTPSGASSACGAEVQGRTGPNWIFANASPTQGGIGMYTQVGPDSNGRAPLLAATSASGIDGTGYNANGLANFVAFRMGWGNANAIRPWLSGQEIVPARVVSRQSMGATATLAGSGHTIQVKQQIMVSLINTECQRGTVRPCQIQYLFNTGAVRSGVEGDAAWERHSPATQGRVWFDRVQAQLPIVAGLLPGRGQTVVDRDSGLPLYRSEGASTEHGRFAGQNFDVRIEWEQLQNAARIIAARGMDVNPAQVTDEQMAARWTQRWNDPRVWTLVATTFGHEIYNDEAGTQRAYVGGGFHNLYVGPEH